MPRLLSSGEPISESKTMNKGDYERYIPEQFDDTHFKVLIETDKCCSCGCHVVSQLERGWGDPFPASYTARFSAQIARAGIRIIASRPNSEALCVECSKSGKSNFQCALCNQTRTTDMKHESFGDPSEYLCEPCYEVTPAKVWDAKVKELEESHRYDFE